MLNVLATDALAESGLEPLKAAAGVNLDIRPTMEPDLLAREIGRYDVVVVRSATRLGNEILGAAAKLKLVIRAGIGVDNIDVTAATERGIIVANTPTGNAIATAEHAFALITALARHIPRASTGLKGGAWEKKKLVGTGLRGKTLGIVGLGNVGKNVARIARGFGMDVVAVDPVISAEAAASHGVSLVGLDELLSRSDIVTVHCPLIDATRGLISAVELGKMKRTAFLINAARGGIVDEDALVGALRDGTIAGAALDVFVTEPPPPDHPLLSFDNVVVTPHIAASTREAQDGVASEASELILEYLENGAVRTALNRIG